MVSPLFYYQLALVALVWLFLMLHVTWRKRGVPPREVEIIELLYSIEIF